MRTSAATRSANDRGWSVAHRGVLALALFGVLSCGARSSLDSVDASVTIDTGVDAGECFMFCEIRQCGPDPLCGRSCGTCAAGQSCTPLGECVALAWREFSSPTGAWLNEVWGTAADDVWIVGGNELEAGSSVLLHFDGRSWNPVSIPTTEPLYSVWGFSRDDVWAVGGHGTILHFDGARWRSVTSTESLLLVSVWGATPNDVWAGGRDGALAHYDGMRWTSASVAGSARDGRASIWGSAPDDIWTVGGPTGGVDSALAHYNGRGWAARERRAIGLSGVWGTSPSNVWTVGDSSKIFHFDGAIWAPAAAPSGAALYDVWGSAADDVWATGWALVLHYDGVEWTAAATPATEGLFGVWGSAADDVWAVGKSGTILHYSATR